MIDLDRLPAEIVKSTRAVLWNRESRKGRETKVPFQIGRPDERAAVNDPSTWGKFTDAVAAVADGKADGAGIVLGDQLIGVDLDDCRDPLTRIIDGRAQQIIDEVDSYTEISPSGTGVHVLVKGTLPPGRRRKGKLEMYAEGRYFTVSGDHLAGTPSTIEDRTRALAAIHGREWKHNDGAGTLPRSAEVNLDDADLLDLATRARNGAKFSALWSGDWSGYESQSEADLALCSMLAFWTGADADRIDRLFRRSGLMRSKWDRSDYREATITKAMEGAEVWRGSTAELCEQSAGGHAAPVKARIDAGDLSLPRVAQVAWDAVAAANLPPYFFRYGSLPVVLDAGEGAQPAIRIVLPDRMRYVLARVADWFRMDKRGIAKDALPPMHVVRDLLAAPAPPLPVLRRIVGAPTFLTNGTLIAAPGFQDGIYLASGNLAVPPVPDCPTSGDLSRALTLLFDELLGDFPFTCPADRAHALALLLLPFVRDLIEGPTPLHLVDKPSPGSGASLLVGVLLAPSLGTSIPMMTEARDEDEWRKRITAKPIGNPQAIIIDNVRRPLDSSALSAAITGDVHEDRLLTRSEMVRLPVRCAWVATGNNVRVSNEILRRTVPMRLDTKTDRPWERIEFRHPELRSWVAEQRGQLVWAALTLVRAWLAGGRPAGKATRGGFESWSRVIGGVLGVAGVPGFLENTNDFYDRADAESITWRAFVSAWWAEKQDAHVTVKELWPLLQSDESLDLGLGDGSERSQKTRLGKRLANMRDRRFGEFTIIGAGTSQNAGVWRLLRAGAEASA
jgi:hypothetical protein